MQINPNCRECCGTGIVQPEQGVTFGGESCTHCDDFPRPAVTPNWPKRKHDGPGLQYEKDPTVTCRGDVRLGTACGHCSKCIEFSMATGDAEALKESRPGERFEVVSDLDIERRALKACGYRVHEKERNGTRWLMAAKGLQVQYKHWHPLTSIHQAMQLLIDCRGSLIINYPFVEARTYRAAEPARQDPGNNASAQDLINAQCRAIVTACASLEPVR